ncbi:hypothetical protein TREES_T100008826 [Tupaia chinensis]|uniref:Uncharacterized protein n=1 Tax=Tupaia chinensis TaxID=246437 RepID=L9L019_TUPCH|nr:hypothetical protein TREES_T100008826 [Tupaia chinensis]
MGWQRALDKEHQLCHSFHVDLDWAPAVTHTAEAVEWACTLVQLAGQAGCQVQPKPISATTIGSAHQHRGGKPQNSMLPRSCLAVASGNSVVILSALVQTNRQPQLLASELSRGQEYSLPGQEPHAASLRAENWEVLGQMQVVTGLCDTVTSRTSHWRWWAAYAVWFPSEGMVLGAKGYPFTCLTQHATDMTRVGTGPLQFPNPCCGNEGLHASAEEPRGSAGRSLGK